MMFHYLVYYIRWSEIESGTKGAIKIALWIRGEAIDTGMHSNISHGTTKRSIGMFNSGRKILILPGMNDLCISYNSLFWNNFIPALYKYVIELEYFGRIPLELDHIPINPI